MEVSEQDHAIRATLLNPEVDEFGDEFKRNIIDEETENVFDGCVTIDPDKLQSAWETLSQDNVGWEIGHLPKIMHDALVSVLHRKSTEQNPDATQ